MNSAFNLVDFDDGPTLVMAHGPIHTEVMDRRRLAAQFSPPSSGVMPVARPIPQSVPMQPVPFVAEAVAPISSQPHPPRPSPDATQPAMRVRRDLEGSRRLVIGLAIGFAFVFGIAASFGTQVFMNGSGSAPPALAARSPRTLTDRSSSLDTRSTPDAFVHGAGEATPSASPAPRTAKSKSKAPTASAATTTTDGHEASTATADEPAESLEGRDLLGEGLGAAP